MTLTQNANPEPIDPDAASEPIFEDAEIALFYAEGLMERPVADVYDVLYTTGFAKEE